MSSNNRIIKYILIGIIAVIAIRYIPSNALLDKDIIIIAICISIGYAIIDKLLPSYQIKP
jgi:hypothetical protein